MPVYNIRYLYQLPNPDGTPGTDGPFEFNVAIRAGNAAGALLQSKIVEVAGISQITGLFKANPTTFE